MCEDLVYIYDGTFDGMMCCVYESVYRRELPFEIVSENDFMQSMFAVSTIETDRQKALRVYNSIVKTMGENALDLIHTMFLSCTACKEMKILQFMLLGYKYKMDTVRMMAHKHVTPMLVTHRTVKSEVHHFKGFIRFTDYDDALVAFIKPKNFVLPFLRAYFCARYKDDNFLIYDKTHKMALVYENGKAEIISIECINTPQVNEKELHYRHLWIEFYKTIAIAARINPKCRMTNMPKRYWSEMIEMQNELERA